MMKKKYLLISLMIVVVMLISLTGCSSKPTTPSGEGQGAEGDVKQEEFPTKPAEALIFVGPGGSGDILIRALAPIVSDYLGQPVVPVNMEGGSGAVALNEMLSRSSDGYTIFHQTSTLPYTITSGGIDVNPDDILPLAIVTAAPQTIVVRADSPFKTLEDFVEHAKANPGSVICGGSHLNGSNHIVFLKLMEAAGIDCQYVPYSGGGDNMLGLLGGDIVAATPSLAAPAPYVESGEMRILAMTGSERHPDYPDVPTFSECGYTSLENDFLWRGLFLKKGTPQHIVDKWEEAIKKAVEDPRWDDYMKTTADDLYFATADEFQKIWQETIDVGTKFFSGK